MSYFRLLRVHNWRQFRDVEIDLSNKITILTGTNGCGKTSLLTLLSRHFGWSIPFVSSPYVSKRAAKKLFKDVREPSGSNAEEHGSSVIVGAIEYDNGKQSQLSVPRFVSANYNVDISNIQTLRGLFIPSHRQQSIYNPVGQIPANPIEASQMYEQFRSIFAQAYQSGGRQQKNPGAVQKETIIRSLFSVKATARWLRTSNTWRFSRAFRIALRRFFPRVLGLKNFELKCRKLFSKLRRAISP